MIVLQTIAVAFAMFSAIPVPQFDWNEKNMRYAMCAFPLIGAVCGALWCLCGALPLPALVRAGGFCLVPVWVTGGIHLDGYADTCDALSSYGGREKKLEIFERPPLRGLCRHPAVQLFSGLFRAVHGRAVHAAHRPLLDAGTGAGAGAFRPCHRLLPAGQEHRPCPHVRFCGRPQGRSQRPAGAGGLAQRCAGAAGRRGRSSLRRFLFFGAIVLFRDRQFGGITGDLAGWFLQKAELWMLAALAAWPTGGGTVMIFITGPLYSGKRACLCCRASPGRPGASRWDVQELAAAAEDLESLADRLAAYDRRPRHRGGRRRRAHGRSRTRRAGGRRAAGLPAGRAGRLCGPDVLRPAHRPERRTAPMLSLSSAPRPDRPTMPKSAIRASGTSRSRPKGGAQLRQADLRPRTVYITPLLPHPRRLPRCSSRTPTSWRCAICRRCALAALRDGISSRWSTTRITSPG